MRVLETQGMKKKDIIFLGFPDGGLCSILMKYQSDAGPDYKSPFTLEDRPPPADVSLPNMSGVELAKRVNGATREDRGSKGE